MGLRCKITKNKDGVVQRVSAPNGKDSILYSDALGRYKQQNAALHAWATAYTEDFNLYYGDWQNSPSEDQSLDANGEPVFSDVESYIDNMRGIAPPLTDADRLSLRSLMVANKIRDIHALNEALSGFVQKGSIVVDRKTLTQSGLYSVDEINHIMEDGVLRRNITDLFSRFNSQMLSEPSARDEYMLSEDLDSELDYDTENYNNAGKREVINPHRIENDLRQALGGIKDRSAFDAAVAALPYESVIDRYLSDETYANELFDRYSAYDRVSVVNAYGGIATTSAASELMYYSTYDEKSALTIRGDIAALTALDPSVWSDDALIKEGLREITKNAANMGIDLFGLEDSYDTKSQAEIEDFLLSLDVFVGSLAPGRDQDTSFTADYDNFFSRGEATTEPVMLREEEKGLNMVVFRNNLAIQYSDVDLYNNFGLIRIRGNIFQRVNKETRESLYDSLYELNEAYRQLYDSPQFPIGDTTGKTKDEVIALFKEWANKNVTYSQSEEMVLNKAIFGFSVDPVVMDVDVQRELNRFVERSKYDKVEPYDNIRLRRLILKEKIKNSPLYNNVLSNIVFDPDGFSLHLTNEDNISLKDLELSVDGDIKNLLIRTALHSSDESLRNLFFIEDYADAYRTADFYRDLYSRHPSLAPQIDVTYREIENRMIKSYYAGNFVAVNTSQGGVIMEKVAEDGGVSVFAPISRIGHSAMDYFANVRNIKPDAYVLNSYDNSMTVEGEYVTGSDLVKQSVIESTIEKRSC